MGQNKILKVGDLVRYMGMNPDMGSMGFATNQIYDVKAKADGTLYIQSSVGMQVPLVWPAGDLTGWTDSVSKHACPLVLPRGQ